MVSERGSGKPRARRSSRGGRRKMNMPTAAEEGGAPGTSTRHRHAFTTHALAPSLPLGGGGNPQNGHAATAGVGGPRRWRGGAAADVVVVVYAAAALLVLAACVYLDSRMGVFGGGSGLLGVDLPSNPGRKRGRLRGGGAALTSPFNARSAAAKADHLVVVAGHSVVVDPSRLTTEESAADESAWYLLDYQRGRGLPRAILGHIRAGVAVAARDPRALLVFSGGETRAATGPLSEGSSYYRVADALGLWDDVDAEAEAGQQRAGMANERGGVRGAETSTFPGLETVRARTVTEEFATDSFENLMFSICRFREVTGSYPRRITVVSFSFKRGRFERLHSSALRWPADRFDYVGYDPPPDTGFSLRDAEEGERRNSVVPFETDPYGCHSPVLQKKRRERNPFSRMAPYELTCPEMKGILKWCGPALYPKKGVPWKK